MPPLGAMSVMSNVIHVIHRTLPKAMPTAEEAKTCAPVSVPLWNYVSSRPDRLRVNQGYFALRLPVITMFDVSDSRAASLLDVGQYSHEPVELSIRCTQNQNKRASSKQKAMSVPSFATADMQEST